MATYGHTFTSGDTVTPTKLNNARTVSEIVNADINNNAAILGTKIAPDFGSQNIVTSGNVGIGTGSPTERLHVSGTSAGGAVMAKVQNLSSASGSQARLDFATGSANSYGILSLQDGASPYGEWSHGTGVTGGMYFTSGTASAPIVFRQSGSERMRIDANGNVGIGTSSPSQKLNVSGGNVLVSHTQPELILNNTSSGSWKSMIRMQNSGTNKWEVGVDSSANGNNNLYFYDNAATAERMRITSGGAVLIGTTSDVDAPSGSNDGIKLDGSGKTITASRDNAATLFLRRRNGDGNVVGFYRDATLVGAVSVTTTATAYNTSSDYRLKENPQPMVGALSRLANVKPVTFTWKSNGSQGEGFIAHELQEVIPDAVTGAKDAVDADGNPAYQGVDASKLVPILVAAVQELSAKVAALEAAQ